MIGYLIALLVKRGVQSRFAAPLVYGGLILIVAGALAWLATCALHRHDNGVIAAHENKISAEINSEVATGTNVADAQANVTAAKDNAAAVQIQEDIHNATVAHPVDAARPVGPVSQSVLNRLRNRPH